MKIKSALAAGRNIVFSDEARAALFSLRSTSAEHNENGGVLIGRLLHSGHIIVDHATPPQPNDRATPRTFFRSDDHQKIIETQWSESHETALYLGEWHSHFETIPSASAVDLDDWARRLKEDTTGIDETIFIIVGIDRVTVYEGSKPRDVIVQLGSIPYADAA